MKVNVRALAKRGRAFAKRNAPALLTAGGILLAGATTVLAVKNTPKAMKHIEEKKTELEAEKLTPVETVKTVYKDYIPAAATGAVAVGCLVGANIAGAKKQAALAAAYAITAADLKEYREKAKELVGEEKEKEIQDAVAQERVNKASSTDKELVEITDTRTLGGKEDIRCFDHFAGGFFWSDTETLDRGINEIGRFIVTDGFAALNDFYEEIGRHPTQLGDEIGWNTSKRLPRMEYCSCLTRDGKPCLSVSFNPPPSYNFDKNF